MLRRVLPVLLVTVPLFAAISPNAIRAHIDFLASDLLEGRETGSRGFDVAAEYVAAQFAAIGLEPAGENGGWFQTVNARTATLDPANCSMTVDGKPLVHRQDVIFRPDFTRTSSDASGAIVFAGFGITAPELQYDDYASIDVKDKIVLILSGAPPRFPPDQRAFYSDRERKSARAAEHGAIGILTVSTRVDEMRSPFSKAAQQAGGRGMRTMYGDVVEEVTPQIRANVGLSAETATMLFAKAPIPFTQILDDAEKGISRSLPLGMGATIHTASIHGTAVSRNVIGRLRGGARENEHVAVTAHLDHLGLATSGDDRVYNGALDNASGIAALIEIARSLAKSPKPKRSIVFVAFTGEEKGGLGSATFADHPTVSTIVGDVNMDMFTMLFPVADVVPLGADHSTLDALSRTAATKAGFEVSPDPQPEEVRFIRSDQYAFVKRGIPAMIFKPGVKSKDPAINGDKISRDWLREVYHSVRDNPDQKLDYASGARWAEANLNLVLAVANAEERPKWKSGDFFGDTFGKR